MGSGICTTNCSRAARTSWSQDKSRNARYDFTPGSYGLELIVRTVMIGRGDSEPGLVQSGDTRQKAPGSSHPHSKPLDVQIRPRVVKYVGQSPTAAGSGAGAWDGHYGCTHSLQGLPGQTRWGSPASANGGLWSTVTPKGLKSGVLLGGLVTEFLACLLHWDKDPRGQTRNRRWGASPKVSHL